VLRRWAAGRFCSTAVEKLRARLPTIRTRGPLLGLRGVHRDARRSNRVAIHNAIRNAAALVERNLIGTIEHRSAKRASPAPRGPLDGGRCRRHRFDQRIDPAMQARFGVDVVPLFVNFGEPLPRHVDLTRDAFYDKLRDDAVLPTTSQRPRRCLKCLRRARRRRPRRRVPDDHVAALRHDNARRPPRSSFRRTDSRGRQRDRFRWARTANDARRRPRAHGADTERSLAALAPTIANGSRLRNRSDSPRGGLPADLAAQAFLVRLVKIVPRCGSRRAIEEKPRAHLCAAQETMVAAASRDANAAPGARVCVIHTRAGNSRRRLRPLQERIVTDVRSFDVFEAGRSSDARRPGAVAFSFTRVMTAGYTSTGRSVRISVRIAILPSGVRRTGGRALRERAQSEIVQAPALQASTVLRGGTPNAYAPAELVRVLALLRERFGVRDDAEVSTEVNRIAA